ncbi:MAG: putative sugar O-methyltransferase [Chloroflexi bacterium]|nr:putative sugar O-methyltransferase [Chloroflexota bacterium]
MSVRVSSFQRTVKRAMNSALGQLDIQLVRKSKLEELRELEGERQQFAPPNLRLPEGATRYLHPNHPRLQNLRRSYAVHPASEHSLWADHRLTVDQMDLPSFRADNMYVWQRRGVVHEAQYAVTLQYVEKFDRLGLLEELQEDDLFGCYTLDIDGITVSRDLLDSIIEINFLDRVLGIGGWPGLKVLDIGAGYGRLAHRMVTALPNVECVFCTDAVPESTFVSEYYLRFRRVDARAQATTLTDIEAALEDHPVELATNIHSFSECPLSSVKWWLDLVRRHEIKYLLIVPNTPNRLVTTEVQGPRLDFLPVLEGLGYRLAAKEPKYAGSAAAQKYGIFSTNYYLFHLEA